MGMKKKLGMGITAAALGLSLIGGGTVAYFSDKEVTQNTFAAGTLDLSVDPQVLVNLDQLKPGDVVDRGFQLINNGTLPIQNIHLLTNYNVVDAKEDNGEQDFGDHIKVKFLWNLDKNTTPIWETTLSELKKATADGKVTDLIDKGIVDYEGKGLAPHTDDTIFVEFEFADNGQDQNVFQGDQLNLNWTFNATQEPGDSNK